MEPAPFFCLLSGIAMSVNRSAAGDFSGGSIPKTILRLAIPMMTAEIVHILYTLVDRMYISRIPEYGTAALSGVGVAFPLITFITAFANLFGTGGNPLCSIARGQGDVKKAECIMNTAFTMLVAVGAVLMIAMYVFAEPLLSLMGGDGDTLPYAVPYFKIYLLGTEFVLISLGMNPYVNGMGFAKIGMTTVILGAVLNIFLDPIFIYTLNLGVRGAAAATVLSQLVSAAWVLRFLMSEQAVMKLKPFLFEGPEALRILKLGISGFTFKFSTSLTQAVVNLTLKQFGGLYAMYYIGAMSIINSLREVISQPISGLNSAAVPVMSFNYGAGLYSRVKKAMKFMVGSCFTYNFLAWIIVMTMPVPFIKLLTPDPVLIEITVPCLRIFYGVYFMMTFQTTAQNTYVAMNRPKFSVFFSMFRKVILVIPLTLALPRMGFGVYGVFLAELISQLVGASCCFITMIFVVYRKLPAKDAA